MGREKGGVTSELPWGTIMSKGYLVTLTDTSKPTSNFKFKKKENNSHGSTRNVFYRASIFKSY